MKLTLISFLLIAGFIFISTLPSVNADETAGLYQSCLQSKTIKQKQFEDAEKIMCKCLSQAVVSDPNLQKQFKRKSKNFREKVIKSLISGWDDGKKISLGSRAYDKEAILTSVHFKCAKELRSSAD